MQPRHARRRRVRRNAFRKASIRSLVERTEAGERVFGVKVRLAQAVAGQTAAPGGVRRVASKWRVRQDSNLWPLPSDGNDWPPSPGHHGCLSIFYPSFDIVGDRYSSPLFAPSLRQLEIGRHWRSCSRDMLRQTPHHSPSALENCHVDRGRPRWARTGRMRRRLLT